MNPTHKHALSPLNLTHYTYISLFNMYLREIENKQGVIVFKLFIHIFYENPNNKFF